MADFVNVGKTSEIEDNKLKLVAVGGEEVVLAKVDGKVFAFGNECPHAGCSLTDDGQLEGEELECICHGSKFNVRTGEVLNGPAEEPLTLYQVQVKGSDVLVKPQAG